MRCHFQKRNQQRMRRAITRRQFGMPLHARKERMLIGLDGNGDRAALVVCADGHPERRLAGDGRFFNSCFFKSCFLKSLGFKQDRIMLGLQARILWYVARPGITIMRVLLAAFV